MNLHIQKVLNYVESNLENDFTLEELAKIAGYSKFHFARIFKMNVGESVIDYIKRLKLEKTSSKIIKQEPIIDIALDVGYETPSSFNKAFKKLFGMSPTEYRKVKSDYLDSLKGNLIETPYVIEMEDKHTVYVREMGEYVQSGIVAWGKLLSNLDKYNLNLENFNSVEFFGLCHDDPTVTKAENLRYEACISIDKDEIGFFIQEGFGTKVIEGGKFAVVRHDMSKYDCVESWFGLYDWCEKNGHEIRETIPFEKYINILECMDNVNNLVYDIYMPIK